MSDRPDERIGMEYDVPERYKDFLARTGLPADVCTFCKRIGRDTRPAHIVRRRWRQRELGQLQTYCDDLHHFDAEQGAFYSSGSEDPLREVCQTCHTEPAVNGACMC